jgi:acyl carrier protein
MMTSTKSRPPAIIDSRVPAAIRQTLIEVLGCDAADITPAAPLADLGLTADLDTVELAMALEVVYSIDDQALPDTIPEDWRAPGATVQTVIDTLRAAGVPFA